MIYVNKQVILIVLSCTWVSADSYLSQFDIHNITRYCAYTGGVKWIVILNLITCTGGGSCPPPATPLAPPMVCIQTFTVKPKCQIWWIFVCTF